MNHTTYNYAGMFATALRWVTGWTYFSAFWRRLVLENKLNPGEAGYIGEKFNHFLPNALGIKPMIEYLVSHPEALWWAMAIFTIVEGIVGLFFMLGLFTRAASIAVMGLALGILLGSGWLGTTCLDEWQIGILGIAAGFTIFLTGGSYYSLDRYIVRKRKRTSAKPLLQWLGSGDLNIKEPVLKKIALAGAVFIFGLSLFTNQYFHGGVYGKLHNLSVRPHVTISEPKIDAGTLSFTVFRDEGADVYGSFLIGVQLKDEKGHILYQQNQEQLAALEPGQIKNSYVAKVKPGKHSLVLPLGARAQLQFSDPALQNLQGVFTLTLTDISGLVWEETISVP
ncbi:MAG: quinol oxidase [Bacteroidetes bacterium 43-16]|nr:MAG: quinol oxidase [Bacteroidetes bacterium 43-16]